MRRTAVSPFTLAAVAGTSAAVMLALSSGERVWYAWAAVGLAITVITLAISYVPSLDRWLNDRLNALAGDDAPVPEPRLSTASLGIDTARNHAGPTPRRGGTYALGIAGPRSGEKPDMVDETRDLLLAV